MKYVKKMAPLVSEKIEYKFEFLYNKSIKQMEAKKGEKLWVQKKILSIRKIRKILRK